MSCEAAGASAPPLLHSQRVGSDNQIVDLFVVQFSTNIHSLNFDSSESVFGVLSLLNSPSDVTLVRSFEGTKAQMLVDFLDHVSE